MVSGGRHPELVEDASGLRPTLGEAERRTLAALVDGVIPPDSGPEPLRSLYREGGRSRGVDGEIARLWAEYFPVEQRAAFLQFLHAVDSPAMNLLLTGRPVRFSRLRAERREDYLLGWAHSRLAAKRRGFQSIKRLATFIYYARPNPGGTNPVWSDIGYVPSSPANRAVGAVVGPPPAGVVRLGSETELACDVCVIGSGAGGAVVAASLASAGHAVVIVESGAFWDRTSFTGREGDSMESMFQRHGLLTTRDLAFQVLAGDTVGGSTTVNWMTCLRPTPLVRREWEAGGADGMAGPQFDAHLASVWERLSVGRAESTINPSNEVLRRGSERLGYAIGRDYDIIDRNAIGCQNRCDYCSYGCRYDAKRSTLVTYLEDAFVAGARLLCETRVDRITMDGGRATGIEATSRADGRSRPIRVRARAVVLAAGAVQTPAILLRSGVRHAGVGRGFRLHPTTALLGEFPHPVEAWKGPMQTVVVRRFVTADADEHGPWLESAPAHPGIAALAVPWLGGRAHKETMSRFGRSAATIVLVRDVGEGRVGLDRGGETELSYRLDQRDRANLIRGLVEAARIHRAAGACRIQTLHSRGISAGDGTGPIGDNAFDRFLEELRRAGIVENSIQLFSAHPTGSAHIGRDPRWAATNSEGECFGVENLWVADGSLLPTAAGVNPMITIMAFARRTAGAIARRLSG